MMGDRTLGQVLVGACAACLCACSDGSNGSVNNSAGAASAGAAGDAADGQDECPEDYRHFAVGPTSTVATDTNNSIGVRVLDGQVPPEYGFNSWTIQLVDPATMAPAPNARITWQCAYMSVHGHGSNPKSIQDMGGGKYQLVDMNMRMFGPWEIQFWIDPTGQMAAYTPTSSNILDGMACSPSSGVQGKPTIEVKACVPRSSD